MIRFSSKSIEAYIFLWAARQCRPTSFWSICLLSGVPPLIATPWINSFVYLMWIVFLWNYFWLIISDIVKICIFVLHRDGSPGWFWKIKISHIIIIIILTIGIVLFVNDCSSLLDRRIYTTCCFFQFFFLVCYQFHSLWNLKKKEKNPKPVKVRNKSPEIFTLQTIPTNKLNQSCHVSFSFFLLLFTFYPLLSLLFTVF